MKHRLIIMFTVLFCAIANASAQDASFFRKYADKGDVEATPQVQVLPQAHP